MRAQRYLWEIATISTNLFNVPKVVPYELKILKRETLLTVFVALTLVSLALIIGSRGFPTLVAWMILENAVPLALVFIVTELVAQDRDLRIIERIFSSKSRGNTIYLRRLFIAFALEMIIVLALACLWQAKQGVPSVIKILSVSIPPTLFLSGLGFVGALLLNDANGGALIGASWWLANEFILRGYGNTGWFGYVFLFKETYYPNSPDLMINRLTLLLLTAVLATLSLALLRKPERYL